MVNSPSHLKWPSSSIHTWITLCRFLQCPDPTQLIITTILILCFTVKRRLHVIYICDEESVTNLCSYIKKTQLHPITLYTVKTLKIATDIRSDCKWRSPPCKYPTSTIGDCTTKTNLSFQNHKTLYTRHLRNFEANICLKSVLQHFCLDLDSWFSKRYHI